MPSFRRLIGFLRPYRAQFLGSLGLACVAIGVTVLIPWLVGRAVNAIEDGSEANLVPIALAILAAAILRLSLTVVRLLIAGRISLAVEFDLRQAFYAHLQRLELGFFDSQQTGQLMSRATVDLQEIRLFLGSGLIFITQNLLLILLAGAAMFAIEPWLALIALAPAPLIYLTASRYIRISLPALQEVQQQVAELTAVAEESVSGIRVVKAFAREEHQLHRFNRTLSRVFDRSVYSTRLQAFFSPLIGLFPQIGMALVLLIGGREVISGNLSLGDFTAFYTYLVMLATPIRMIGLVMGIGQQALASGNRLFEVLDRKPRIESPPHARPLPPGGGRVELRGVTLRYEGAGGHGSGEQEVVPALSGIGLDVEAHKTVALVGPSGSGKTSLVALIARLYDPEEGTVLVDGADVRELDLTSLRSEVAFVSGDSFLFAAGIAENIAYARPEATIEEIEDAARLAHADAFIRELPDGYATRVGERGLTLSGGQRQRLAIARALLADPRILILDDATSSVDAATEAEIRSGLRQAMVGRTTLIIAHRLSTLSLADEVVVMDAGRIVDRGTHDELKAGSGFYREIADHGLPDSVFLQRDLGEREEAARL